MNILMITHDLPAPDDGSLTRSYHFIRELQKQGHSVRLLTLISKQKPQYKSQLQNWCETIDTVEIPDIDTGVTNTDQLLHILKNTIHPTNLKGDYSPFFSIRYSIEFQKLVRNSVQQYDPDCILLDLLPLAYYVPEQIDSEVVIDVKDAKFVEIRKLLQEDLSTGNQLRNYIQLWSFDRWATEAIERGFTTWVGVSDRDAEKLSDKYPTSKTLSIPNGVDCQYFTKRSQSNPGKPALVFVGDMGYIQNIKAIQWFVQGPWELIRKEMSQIQLNVVGRNPGEYIKGLDEKKGINVTGSVPDVRPFLSKSTVSIAPMVASSGVLNKILEAMAAGLPVIGTEKSVEGLDPRLEETVIVAEGECQFAQRTIDLLSNDEARKNLGNKGREKVKRYYSWEASVNELLANVQ